jgi:hypothetical protein
VAGDDPALLAMFLELQLKAGHADVAAQVATQLAASSDERPRVLEVGRRAGPADAAAGFVCFEAVADLLLGAEDWDGAAATLQEFGDVAPHFAPALLRLVEVCVDGGLDARLYDAQARLAEAYLHEGRAFEASVISEDLAVREPNVGSHIDRLRRALVMMGESAPDRVIAERLSGAMLAVGSDQPSSTIETHDGPLAPASPAPSPPVPSREAVTPAAAVAPPPQPVAPEPIAAPPPPPQPVSHEIVLPTEVAASLVASPAPAAPAAAPPPPPPAAAPAKPTGEIDLTTALTELAGSAPPAEATAPPAPVAPPPPPVPARPAVLPQAPAPAAAQAGGAVFGEFREAVSQQTAADLAAQQYKLALTYRDMGMHEEAVAALELASRSPAHRFLSAAALGRLYWNRNAIENAVYWFERAVEAPAPSVDEGRSVIYELGDLLERTNENARALSIFLELQADAGEFRDVAARVERLSRVVTGG